MRYDVAQVKLERLGLQAGVCVPLLYFGTVIMAAIFIPGYRHVRQAASELGMATVPHPAIFNRGVMLVGICMLAASPIVWMELRRVGVSGLPAAYIGVALASLGIAWLFAAYFPAPNPMHRGFGFAYPIAFAPLAAIELRRHRGFRLFARYSLIVFLGFVVLTPEYLARHAAEMRPYGGLFQRLISLLLFPWVALLAYVLLRGVSVAPPKPLHRTAAAEL